MAKGVQSLSGLQEVLGSNHLMGNIMGISNPSKETVDRDPNTPIPTTHTLICEELKYPGISPKVIPK